MDLPINVKSPNNVNKWQMGFNSEFKGLNTVCKTAVISCVPRTGHEMVTSEHRGHSVRTDEGPHDPLTFAHFVLAIRRMRATNCQRRRNEEGSVRNMGIEIDWLKKKVNDMSVETDWLTYLWMEMKTKVTSFS
jgi:hypothetical protein